jgi:hypothetical protein
MKFALEIDVPNRYVWSKGRAGGRWMLILLQLKYLWEDGVETTLYANDYCTLAYKDLYLRLESNLEGS